MAFEVIRASHLRSFPRKRASRNQNCSWCFCTGSPPVAGTATNSESPGNENEPYPHHSHRQPAAHGESGRATDRRREQSWPAPRRIAGRRARGRRRTSCASRSNAASTSSMTANRAAPTTPCTSCKRLTGYEGESAPPMGTGEPEFPELAAKLKHFASPFQHRPACNGPGRHGRIGQRRRLTSISPKRRCRARKPNDIFMTSPSPGQIARYLKNRYYKNGRGLHLRARRRHAARISGDRRGRLHPPARLPRSRDAAAHGLSRPAARRLPQDHRHQCCCAQSRGARPSTGTHAHACVLGLDHGAAPHRR